MNILTKWLTFIYEDLPSKACFRTLDIDKYREAFEEFHPTCEKIKVPIFYSDRIDLGQINEELNSTYIELYIENAGYKQPHEYLLTSILKNGSNKIAFCFTSEYSNWAAKRIVSISPDCRTIYRNDFKDVYSMSWEDYKNDRYQKGKKTKAPCFKRTLTTF